MKKEILDKIEENARKIKELRGAIIHNSIDIEKGISFLIIKSFFKDKGNNEIIKKLMLEEQYNFGVKINMLKDFIIKEPYYGFFKEIKRLKDIRNIFAHAPLEWISGGIIHNNKLKNPKELHDEFFKLHGKLLNELNKLINK